MTERNPPNWLEALEARFGEMLRTPLDRTSGTLTATPDAYPKDLRDDVKDGPNIRGEERLAVYNRQYWFRLFEAMQTAFPLTTRLLGHWRFNDYAGRFLLAHPPRGWDLDHVADGFEAFFATELDSNDERASPRDALREAAHIDACWHVVFRAPAVHAFRPTAADAERLLDSRLTFSPAVALVEEHWPLLELRRSLRDDPSEKPAVLPPPLPGARSWALVRTDVGMGQLPLEAREAELFRLLAAHTVRDALARLEASCTEEERAELPTKTQAWLARSVELELWMS